MMDKSRIVIGVGALMLVIGIYVTYGAFPSLNDSKDFTIPEGDYYYLFQSNTLIGGSTHGSFSVSSGPAVKVMVFTQAQYDEFASTGVASALASDTGSSGDFSASLHGTGKITLVFVHATTDTSQTTVHVDMTLSGIAQTSLIIGIALLAAGAVIVVFGFRMRGKEAKMAAAAPPSPVATDVTILKK